MTTRSSSMEADLLRELLAEAHARIRELDAQVEHLGAALLTISLNDRRSATGSSVDGSGHRERRRAVVSAAVPAIERRAGGRRSSSRADST
jgi:hypothetical protein